MIKKIVYPIIALSALMGVNSSFAAGQSAQATIEVTGTLTSTGCTLGVITPGGTNHMAFGLQGYSAPASTVTSPIELARKPLTLQTSGCTVVTVGATTLTLTPTNGSVTIGASTNNILGDRSSYGFGFSVFKRNDTTPLTADGTTQNPINSATSLSGSNAVVALDVGMEVDPAAANAGTVQSGVTQRADIQFDLTIS
ncbi:hypothetical protein [Cysteiniphilum sp. 6C5]|uniref:hypothetical protein n=1 Tax=unclassified Cysteiniphilum TaxID=2610889 RepID=UPI003F8625C1